MPKYPDVEVSLVGKDGNAIAIISRVTYALTKAKVPIETVETFVDEAMSGDYNHVLNTCLEWVKCG